MVEPYTQDYRRLSIVSSAITKAGHIPTLLTAVAISTGLCTPMAWAQTAMVDLGTLPGGTDSFASGISADGTIVVGVSSSDFGAEAFRWTAGGGMTRLAGLANTPSEAEAISGNGLVIAGSVYELNAYVPYRWSEEGGVEFLQSLSGYDYTQVTAINFDGAIVVGEVANGVEGSERAVRWKEDGSILDLGTLAGGSFAFARDVSDDGTIVIGKSDSGSGVRSFKWTQAKGMEALDLPPGTEAFVISGDGKILAGTRESDILSQDGEKLGLAVRWAEGGAVEALGSLPGSNYSFATDINYDGNVIVGESGVSGDYMLAFRWTTAGGMESLGTLEGHRASEASAVSADGTVVVGTSFADGYQSARAFIWRGAIQDYANLSYSFIQMADATEVALQQNSDLLEGGINSTCSVKAGYSYCLSLTGGAQTSESPAEDGGWTDGTQGFGTVTVGLGTTDHLTVGAMLTSYTGTDADFAEWNSPALGVGAYATYSQTGDYVTGFNAGVRGGMSSSEMTFVRGSNLSDVQVSREDSGVQSYIAIAEASYGFAVNDRWVASPTARLKWEQSERDGYSESDNLAFSADYDSATEESISLAIGIDQRFVINEHNALRLGFGAEADLSYSEPEISGTSNMPEMSSFEINSDLDRNEWRGFADVEHQFLFGPEKMLTTRFYIETPTYGSEAVLSASASLRLSF